MKSKLLIGLMFSLMLSLGACTQMDDSKSDDVVEEKEEQADTHTKDELYNAVYVEEDQLPEIEGDVEKEYKNEDRMIVLNTDIENELELMTYNHYYYATAKEFTKLKDMAGSDIMKTNADNLEKQFDSGEYMLEYTIDEFDDLSMEDIQEADTNFNNHVSSVVETNKLTSFHIVEVEVSWKQNEAFSKVSQIYDGKFDRYFVYGKTADDDTFKLYEILNGENYKMELD